MDAIPIPTTTASPFAGERKSTLLTVGILLLLAIVQPTAEACPFCISESRTLTEEIADSSVVLLARLVEPSESADAVREGNIPFGLVDPETGAAKFSVEQVLLGEEVMQDIHEIKAIYFGDPDFETMFLVRGLDTPPEWTIPLSLSDIASDYVPQLFGLPESGADRLAFFQEYLEHDDPLLAQDAYDEFARAPYQDVLDLNARMDRTQLIAWIKSPRISPSHRRLYLTMLGVCGGQEDLERVQTMLLSDVRAMGPGVDAGVAASLAGGGPWSASILGEVIRMGQRQQKLGLDAMIACYLTLSGKQGAAAEGLDLVDQRFLRDPDANYSHVYASLMAIRFLAEEQGDLVPLERVLASARLLLDSHDFADQVIPDLARWEDWSVLDRLVDLYKSSTEPGANKYLREPVITYLDVASEQQGEVGERATAALVSIESIDPDAVRRARSLQAFGFLAQARAKAADSAAPAAEEAVAEAPAVAPPTETEAVPNSMTPEEPTIAAEPEATPPNRLLLLVAPSLAAGVCIALLWGILRGGSA